MENTHATRQNPFVTTLVLAAVATGLVIAGSASAPSAQPRPASKGAVEHVLLISVDGLHQNDLTRYVAAHPTSPLLG